MITVAIASFIAMSGLLALGVIADSLHRAAPQVFALKSLLDGADQTLAVRIRIVETVVAVDDGKVLAFPVRPRPLAPAGLRAAA